MIDDNQICVYFDKGKFDDYCVFVNCPTRYRYAPTDDAYFKWILELSNKYGTEKVWDDFNIVYDLVVDGEEDKKFILGMVHDIDKHYKEDTMLWWLIFYMTMVAEQKKRKCYS